MVHVHQAVIGCRSEFFASVLGSGSKMKEGGKEVVLKVSAMLKVMTIINQRHKRH